MSKMSGSNRIQTITEEMDENLSSEDNKSSHESEDNDALFNQDLIKG
jgi:hypothetical protein